MPKSSPGLLLMTSEAWVAQGNGRLRHWRSLAHVQAATGLWGWQLRHSSVTVY